MLGVRLTQIPWFPGDRLQYPIISYHHRIGFCWGPRHRQRVPQPRLLCEWAWHWHWHGIGMALAWHTLVICFANSFAKPQRQISGPPYQEARSNKLHLSCSPLANVSGKRRSDASGSLSLRHFFQAILAVCQDPFVGQK